MDGSAAIEQNRVALKRIVASLVAMAGPAVGPHPKARAEGEPRSTLPRHLWIAILRLLRPAEAAARRLIIAAARGIIVPPPPQRPRKPKPTILRKGVGTGLLTPSGPKVRPAARTFRLPLTDPLRRLPGRRRPRPRGVPRISIPGFSAPFPVPVRRPPSPFDPIDGARLARRLAALGRALDDLPAEARRFARWRAARAAAGAQIKEGRDAGRIRRRWPLRAGRPPGQSRANGRRPTHEVHEILNAVHDLAFWALESPDTS